MGCTGYSLARHATLLCFCAQAEGVKSKRHMKLMLQDLKLRGWVSTRPPPADSARRDRAYRYLLSKKAKPAAPSTASDKV